MIIGDLVKTLDDKYVYSRKQQGMLSKHKIPKGSFLTILGLCDPDSTGIYMVENFWHDAISNNGIVIIDCSKLQKL